MLSGPHPAQALHLLHEHKLDGPTLNEDTNEASLDATDRLGNTAEIPARLAAWMIDRTGERRPSKRITARWRKALSLSNDHRDELGRLFEVLERIGDWETLAVAQRKRLAAHPSWPQALLLRDALDQDADPIASQAKQLANDGIGLAPPPLLAGDDLIAIGLAPGPAFKTLLDEAYDQQLEGELKTREQAIAWLQGRSSQTRE